jgi:hypothetical protein
VQHFCAFTIKKDNPVSKVILIFLFLWDENITTRNANAKGKRRPEGTS